MFIQADVKGLELACAGWLSKDPVLCEELRTGVDIHAGNQAYLDLPDRKTAKIFVFRYIYGGTEFSYSQDPDFMWISSKPKYWRELIEEFNGKYKGLCNWHNRIIRDAQRTGTYVTPATGRSFTYTTSRNYRGETVWPITCIKNYPVQGLGADLVSLARIKSYKQLYARRCTSILCSSVHDSLVVDARPSEYRTVVDILKEGVESIPDSFLKVFKVEFDLPITAEIKVGPNLRDLVEI